MVSHSTGVSAVRNALVTALLSCAEIPCRSKIRRFLAGLSSDELQFLAEFYGACIVEGGRAERVIEAKLAGRCLHRRSPDDDHKLILLHEYLARAGAPQAGGVGRTCAERSAVRAPKRVQRSSR
jgi:hypothetical protein